MLHKLRESQEVRTMFDPHEDVPFVGADPSLTWIPHVQVGEFVRTDLSFMWIPWVQVEGLMRTDLSLMWIPQIQMEGLVGSGPVRHGVSVSMLKGCLPSEL